MVNVKLTTRRKPLFCAGTLDSDGHESSPLAGIIACTDVCFMTRTAVTAVLGPTNTGKTHLAIERLCAHSSGMMGFPLRLLAREVYDRVRAIKGDASVGLITGEEKILPANANWLICTVESMPVERDVAFVAIDEAQIGADPERGHVFTDRILNVRGREETMILGSATVAPLIRALVPEAEIIKRPRFSSLTYAGPKKLSRLPPRSAIVAFSAEEVYGIAEMIRRTRGGSAVVMGALSPRTRNAQVAMFESGEVDYLVATDAIGMGLNLDLGHVAFASLSKFDGKRQRRLLTSEMAQIAGRAGRHQRDGSFGVLAGGLRQPDFTEVEIDRIENHHFTPLVHLYWRNADPQFDSIDTLIGALEAPPDHPNLRPAPEAVDLAVLKRLAEDQTLRAMARHPAALSRLWEVCGLPDFRHMGAEFHARQVFSIFQYLVSDIGVIPSDIIAAELARLDTTKGDITALTTRISAARTWAYATQRRDWLAEPEHWADAARALEQKLSDALHEKLTQRFVDRRTTLLVRSMGADATALDVRFGEEGSITVEGEPLGRLDGFDMRIDHLARLEDRKRLTAAVERELPKEIARRAQILVGAPDRDFTLVTCAGLPVKIGWKNTSVATLVRGRALLSPALALHPALLKLPAELRAQILQRLVLWLDHLLDTRLAPLKSLLALSNDPHIPAAVRAVAASLASASGVFARSPIEASLDALTPQERRRLRQAGVVIGALDIFHHGLLKPEATRIRLALLAVHRGQPMPPLPMPGLTLLDQPSTDLAQSARDAGYRGFGEQMLRIDLVERIARALHDQRGRKPVFAPDTQIATQLGVGEATLAKILRALGFFPSGSASPELWRWRGRQRSRAAVSPTNSSFEALRQWTTRGAS